MDSLNSLGSVDGSPDEESIVISELEEIFAETQMLKT